MDALLRDSQAGNLPGVQQALQRGCNINGADQVCLAGVALCFGLQVQACMHLGWMGYGLVGLR